eukprot:g935.t1
MAAQAAADAQIALDDDFFIACPVCKTPAILMEGGNGIGSNALKAVESVKLPRVARNDGSAEGAIEKGEGGERGENVEEAWEIEDVELFSNIAVTRSRRVLNENNNDDDDDGDDAKEKSIKYLACAECEYGPIGWKYEGGKACYVAPSRIVQLPASKGGAKAPPTVSADNLPPALLKSLDLHDAAATEATVTFDGTCGMELTEYFFEGERRPFTVVTAFVGERSAAAASGKVRLGDIVVSVSGNGVLHAGVEDILDRIRTAERPVEITFSRREQQ